MLGVSCLNLFMAGAVGRIMHATLPGRYANGLIMELPLYHRPNFRTIFGNVRTRAVLFPARRCGQHLRGSDRRLGDQHVPRRHGGDELAVPVSGGGWNPSVRFWGLTGGLRSRC